MKDIDFDELDRAVGSVLGAQNSAPAEESSEVAVSEPATSPTITEEETTQKTFVQKRATGRFMDVVHPSSDMKLQNKPSVSRQGVSVEPVSPQATEEAPEAPVESAPIEEPAYDIPDPLTFQAAPQEEPEEVEASAAAPAIAPVTPVETDMPSMEADETDSQDALDQAASELAELDSVLPDATEPKPLDTPFVSAADVEKRPLGAFSATETDASLLSDEARSHLEAADANEPAAAEPPVDEEMKRAMDAALAGHDKDEAPTDALASDTHESAEAADPEAEAQTSPEADVMPEELHEDVVAVESQEVEPASVIGTGSIPQQYTEKATAQSEEIAPVFDTTPIQQTAPKHSVWPTVLLILVFILLGAGIGFAVYYFDLLKLIS